MRLHIPEHTYRNTLMRCAGSCIGGTVYRCCVEAAVRHVVEEAAKIAEDLMGAPGPVVAERIRMLTAEGE